MTAGKTKTDPSELRMDAGEFDRIMGRALRVKPGDGKPKKIKANPKKKDTSSRS